MVKFKADWPKFTSFNTDSPKLKFGYATKMEIEVFVWELKRGLYGILKTPGNTLSKLWRGLELLQISQYQITEEN